MEITAPNPKTVIQKSGLNFATGKGVQFASGSLLSIFSTASTTPADASGAGLVLTGISARYFRMGGWFNYQFWLTYPVNANGANVQLTTALPVSPVGSTAEQFALYTNTIICAAVGPNSQISLTTPAATITNATLSGALVRGVISGREL